jgi:DNA-binding CsgD family transcriptional regulator
VLSVAALVFVIDPEQAPRSRATVLRSLFHLTPAESRIADGLLEGFEVAEVAERLGITQQTARFHVKRVLAKTGARRQSDLLRIMLTLPAIR